MGTLTPYLDPSQMSRCQFGRRSFYTRPDRAWVETVPSSKLHDAPGLNYNAQIHPGNVAALSTLIASFGYKNGRTEEGFGSVSYDNPNVLNNDAEFTAKLQGMAGAGIEPLVLLNCNSGAPCPNRMFDVTIQAAAQGATQVTITGINGQNPSDLVAGRSGLSNLSDYWQCEYIFTDIQFVPSGAQPVALASGGTRSPIPDQTPLQSGDILVCTLSKPLRDPIGAGIHRAGTLKYLPMMSPTQSESDETNAGIRSYVRLVATRMNEALAAVGYTGPKRFGGYNELSFDAYWLDWLNTFTQQTDAKSGGNTFVRIIAEETQDPSSPAYGYLLATGMANQTPFVSGVSASRYPSQGVVPGVYALDKHPYAKLEVFDGSPYVPEDGLTRIDANGNQTTFQPSLISYFPEDGLTLMDTEGWFRDLWPGNPLNPGAAIYGTPHGKYVNGRSSSSPTVWLTEQNASAYWDPASTGPDSVTFQKLSPGEPATLADTYHMEAKNQLRLLCMGVNKGMERLYTYGLAPDGQLLEMLGQNAFDTINSLGGNLPGTQTGIDAIASIQLTSLKRLLAAIPTGQIDVPRSLLPLSVSDTHDQYQFLGDGTPNNPTCYNRDRVSISPYQIGTHDFALAAYVMTFNTGKVYAPGRMAGGSLDPTRFDLPPAMYDLTVAGVNPNGLGVTATDPLSGASVPISFTQTSAGITLHVPLTDSPRIIRLQEATTAMQIPYVFEAIDDNGNPVDDIDFDLGGVGGNPGVSICKTLTVPPVVNDAVPAVYGFGARADGSPSGKFFFFMDSETPGEQFIEFDLGGAGAFTGTNRYRSLLITRDSGRVQAGISATGAVDASASVAPLVAPLATAAQLAPLATHGDIAPLATHSDIGPLATAAQVAGVQTALTPLVAEMDRVYGAEWGSIVKNGDGSYSVTAPGTGAVIGTVRQTYVGGVLQASSKSVV